MVGGGGRIIRVLEKGCLDLPDTPPPHTILSFNLYQKCTGTCSQNYWSHSHTFMDWT